MHLEIELADRIDEKLTAKQIERVIADHYGETLVEGDRVYGCLGGQDPYDNELTGMSVGELRDWLGY